jgi:hypothetical protein
VRPVLRNSSFQTYLTLHYNVGRKLGGPNPELLLDKLLCSFVVYNKLPEGESARKNAFLLLKRNVFPKKYPCILVSI